MIQILHLPAWKTYLLRAAVFALLVFIAGPLFADGKMYSEKVNPNIPYQRALILFEEGKETLVLQSQYRIPNISGKHTIGWVVPVPAVPEIASMHAREADSLFRRLDLMSYPEITRWGWRILAVPLVLFACVLMLSLVGLLQPSLSRHRKQLKRFSIAGACGLPLVFLASILSISQSKGIDGVEVVKAAKIGIFDTKVIRSDSSKGLIAWLNANSFQFAPGDEKAIQAHIDRKWCFVTAKVDASSANPHNRSAVSDNLLAPLILQFSTPKPVYPTALTATGGHSTEILIYLGSDGPMKTASALVPRFRDHVMHNSTLVYFLEVQPMEFAERLPSHFKHLSKFKATLTPEQMSRDIEFVPDPGAPPLREHLHKW